MTKYPADRRETGCRQAATERSEVATTKEARNPNVEGLGSTTPYLGKLDDALSENRRSFLKIVRLRIATVGTLSHSCFELLSCFRLRASATA